MACDTALKPRQTLQERAKEVREATERLAAAIAAGRVRVKVSAQGGIVFEGWDNTSRDGVTDGCALRRILATGSAMAKLAIQKAEQLAGRTLDKKAIAQGLHSHDGGATWHRH